MRSVKNTEILEILGDIFKMKSLLLLAVFVVLSTAAKLKDCGVCDKDACPKMNCLAGKTLDKCGCCEICYKMEGEGCDNTQEPTGYGDCGNGLMCSKIGDGHYCICETEEILCGEDGVTYNNLCEMWATEARTGKNLEKSKDGPCDPAAKIVTAPDFTRNYTGGSIVLSCEAVGNPTPAMAWLFTRVDGKSSPLPGDDERILIAARGGPGKFQVTGWLQIEGLKKEHEGDYTCVAKNSEKKVHAKARVKVEQLEAKK